MSDRLAQITRRSIDEHHLLDSADRILVAVSGGVDSVVLLHVLIELDCTVEVAHVNYHLRGSNSDGDEAFVRRLCEEMSIPIHVHHVWLKDQLESLPGSLQEEARNIRYTYFEEILNTRDLTKVATAHHLDDNIETVLLNLVKGSGPSGMTGIPRVNGRIIRPLLDCTHEEIIIYARSRQLIWRTDATNDNLIYDRNRMRHSVIPEIEKIHPGYRKSMGRSIANMVATNDALSQYVEWLRGNMKQTDPPFTTFDLHAVAGHSLNIATLYLLVSPYGFNHSQCGDILTARSGAEFHSSTHILVVDRASLHVAPNDIAKPKSISIQEEGIYSNGYQQLILEQTRDIEHSSDVNVDLIPSAITSFPLTWRPWQPGDQFQPFGMAGKHQKVQDYFTDRKVSFPDKWKGTVLVDHEGVIIWLVGFRLDERFKCQPHTEEAIRLSLK